MTSDKLVLAIYFKCLFVGLNYKENTHTYKLVNISLITLVLNNIFCINIDRSHCNITTILQTMYLPQT